MKKLIAERGKVLARCVGGEFACGGVVYLPDHADVSQWAQYDSKEQAREHFGVEEEIA